MSIRRLADLVCELPEGTDPGLRCWVPSEACSTAGKGKGERDFQNQRQQCHLLPQNLYESIKNEPFKIPEDDGNDLTHTFFNPDREGWLLKLGKRCPSGLGLLTGPEKGRVCAPARTPGPAL